MAIQKSPPIPTSGYRLAEPPPKMTEGAVENLRESVGTAGELAELQRAADAAGTDAQAKRQELQQQCDAEINAVRERFALKLAECDSDAHGARLAAANMKGARDSVIAMAPDFLKEQHRDRLRAIRTSHHEMAGSLPSDINVRESYLSPSFDRESAIEIARLGARPGHPLYTEGAAQMTVTSGIDAVRRTFIAKLPEWRVELPKLKSRLVEIEASEVAAKAAAEDELIAFVLETL